MVRLIMGLVDNRSFTLTAGNGKRNRLWRLKKGVTQRSLLSPFSTSTPLNCQPPSPESMPAPTT